MTLQNAHKCDSCRYAISVTGRCNFHDLPMVEAEKLNCDDTTKDLADGVNRPRTSLFERKKSSSVENFLYGFLTLCGAILFIMAVVLFTTSEDEGWRGIWGVIGFFFLGGLGILCFYGSLKHLRDAHEERKKAAQKEP